MIVTAPEKHLTTAEFAAAVGRHIVTVRQWVTNGTVKAIRRNGPGKQPYFIPESEVRAFAGTSAVDVKG